MGFLGGIGQVFTNPMNLLAIATMNPAIIAATIAKQLMSQIGQQVIQGLGEQLGLPQTMIDTAQAAFCAACGDQNGVRKNFAEAAHGLPSMMNDFFDTYNVGPMDRGRVERASGDFKTSIADTFNELFDQFVRDKTDKNKEATAKAGAKEGQAGGVVGSEVAQRLGIEGGFLVQFAALLGKVIDNKTDDMMKLAREMNQTSDSLGDIRTAGKSDSKGQQEFQKQLSKTNSELGQMGALLNGLGKEIEAIQNALKSSLDSIGQAQSALARKQ